MVPVGDQEVAFSGGGCRTPLWGGGDKSARVSCGFGPLCAGPFCCIWYALFGIRPLGN